MISFHSSEKRHSRYVNDLMRRAAAKTRKSRIYTTTPLAAKYMIEGTVELQQRLDQPFFFQTRHIINACQRQLSRFRHQIDELLPLAPEAGIVIRIEMGDEHLIRDLAHLLH